jgi:hypothetical protein
MFHLSRNHLLAILSVWEADGDGASIFQPKAAVVRESLHLWQWEEVMADI